MTLPREEREKNHRLEMDQTFLAFVRGQVLLSGPTVELNHGKATKKHKGSMWY